MDLFVILIIATVLTTTKAEVDCNNRPPHINLNSCCELSNVIAKEVEEKCTFREDEVDAFGPNHDHGPPRVHGGPSKFGPHHNHCFLSCVVNETGILVNNEFQENKVSLYLNELFDDSEKVEFLYNKFMFCNERRHDFESKHPKNRHGPPHCAFQENGMLMNCVRMQTFKDCPDLFWSNTDECNEVRDHFNLCWAPKENIGVEEEKAEEI